MLKKFVYSVLFIITLSTVIHAQEQAVYLTADIPAKKNIVSQDITVGGEVYLSLLNGRVVVKSDLSFKDTVAFLLNTPDQVTIDQLALSGTARIYLNSNEVKNRLFVEGGITNVFALDTPVDGITINQAKSAVGFNFNNRVIPRFEFATQDFTGSQFAGREYKAEVTIFIPIQKVRIGLQPYFISKLNPLPVKEYGISLKFGRTF